MEYKFSSDKTDVLWTHENERVRVLPEQGAAFNVDVWDYPALYQHPFLYESLLVDFFQCQTHKKSVEHFAQLRNELGDRQPLSILDFAAGVGLVGAELKETFPQLKSLVGVDRCAEAAMAVKRDRPNVYSEYFDELANLERFQINTIFCLSAVGYGDVDQEIFKNFFQILPSNGWLVFNTRRDLGGGQEEVMQEVERQACVVHNSVIFHRYLLNGEKSFFRSIIARKR